MGKKNKNKKNVSSKNKNVKKVEKPPEKPEEHKSSSPTDDNEPTSFSSLRIDEEPSEAPRTSLLREMIYTYCSLVLFYKFLSLHRTSENLKTLRAKVALGIRIFYQTIIYEVLFQHPKSYKNLFFCFEIILIVQGFHQCPHYHKHHLPY